MKALITGQSDFSLEVLSFFDKESRAISRSSGHDIEDENVRKEIALESLKYDIFINHAHTGHIYGQTSLLCSVYNLWKSENKDGLIINSGSYATDSVSHFERWVVIKKALDLVSKKFCDEIQSQNLPMRMCTLKLGTLDHKRSRAKGHWPGSGIKPMDFYKIIESLYRLPKELVVSEFVVRKKLPTHN